MKVEAMLEVAYGRTKKGDLKHYAYKFVEKYGVDMNTTLTEYEALELMIKLSPKKQPVVLAFIKDYFQSMVEEVEQKVSIHQLRTESYKTIARMTHPDSPTGNTRDFQCVQEIKEFFWDFQGKPREKLGRGDWYGEKMRHNGYEWRFYDRSWYNPTTKDVVKEV